MGNAVVLGPPEICCGLDEIREVETEGEHVSCDLGVA